MSKREKIARSMFWSAVERWGGVITNFLVFLVLARLLAPEDFGVIALAHVATELASVFAQGGFPASIVQREKIEPEHLDTVFWTTVGIAVLLASVIALISGWIAGLYDEPILGPILVWLSVSLVLNSLNLTQGAILRRQMSFKALAIRTNVASISGGIVGIGCAFASFGVWSLVAMSLTGSAVSVIVLWWATDWRPRFRYSLPHLKDVIGFGASFAGARMLNIANRRVDVMMIGATLGSTQLGYYQVGARISRELIKLVTGTGSSVVLPAFSRLQTQPKKLLNGFYEATRLTSLIGFPIFTGLCVLAPEITQVVFGAKWIPAIPVVRFFAIIGLVRSVYMFNGSVILAMGKASWRMWTAAGNLLTTIITLLLVMSYGLEVIAGALAARFLLYSPVTLVLLKKLIDYSLRNYFVNLFPALASSLSMAAGVYLVNLVLEDSVAMAIRLLVLSLIAGLVYVLTLRLIAKKSLDALIEFVLMILKRKRIPKETP